MYDEVHRLKNPFVVFLDRDVVQLQRYHSIPRRPGLATSVGLRAEPRVRITSVLTAELQFVSFPFLYSLPNHVLLVFPAASNHRPQPASGRDARDLGKRLHSILWQLLGQPERQPTIRVNTGEVEGQRIDYDPNRRCFRLKGGGVGIR